MDVTTRQLGNVLVVALQGRIDQATAEQLRLTLEPHIASCSVDAPLILDFSGISYISSVGLRVLMLAARQVTAQHGQMAIVGLQPVVREIFQISRFDMVFKIHESVATAAAALATPAT